MQVAARARQACWSVFSSPAARAAAPPPPPAPPPLYRPHASISPICPTTNDKTATNKLSDSLFLSPSLSTHTHTHISSVLFSLGLCLDVRGYRSRRFHVQSRQGTCLSVHNKAFTIKLSSVGSTRWLISSYRGRAFSIYLSIYLGMCSF